MITLLVLDPCSVFVIKQKRPGNNMRYLFVVLQGLISAFATDMNILGEWLERWYWEVQEA